jgi:hypothetical protein
MPAARNSAAPLALGAAAVLATVLAGCGQYYWSRAGTSPADFYRDSQECARRSALGTATTVGVGVDDRLYRGCLRERGYVRGQQSTPPPPGWYRGIE